MRARVFDGIANLSAELDDGLVHLRFDLLFEHNLAALEDLLNVRAQLARLRINDREFLFDTESEYVVFYSHRGVQMSLKNEKLSSRVARKRNIGLCPVRPAEMFSAV